ncbi:MAG: Acetyl coenzyme A synthase alpha subunit [Parcubacteria group bacterium GW2011_GWA2_38_13]|nr:MAG: Acetyl coenzyme A synthase alpha subunit [Parcubacteria group bacterium GW2011_GWA2_38_13]
MLKSLLYPKSIAIIGASSDSKKIGYSIAANITAYKFKGKTYFVNIHKDIIMGKKSYASILDISEKVDLAIIIIPSRSVNTVLEDCGKKGVSSAIIISAGFSEVGEEGKKLEEEMKQISQKYSMQVLGPNCLGLLNSQNNLNASFADGMIRDGNVAFFSQSGALCSAMLDWAVDKNFGFSQFMSIGNKAVIDESTVLEFFREEKSAQIILGYLEGFKRGKKFIEEAKKCVDKPIILLKGAESQQGIKVAASHTGAMAQDDKIVDAALSDANIIRAKDLEDFFHLAMFFSWQPMLEGGNIAIVTNAGGLAVVTTDAVAKSSVTLASFEKESIENLKKFLPESSNMQNPLDIIGDADPDRYKQAIVAIKKDKNVNGILLLLTPQTVTDVKNTAEQMVLALNGCNKPVAACFLGGARVSDGVRVLLKNRIPTFEYPHQAVRMFDAMHQYIIKKEKLSKQAMAQKYKKICLKPKIYEEIKNNISETRRNGFNNLHFKDCFRLLDLYEIPKVKTQYIESKNTIESLLSEFQFPLYAKIDSPHVLHKSDSGGVVAKITDMKMAVSAYEQILKNIKKNVPGAKIHSVVFQEMVGNSLEVIIGAKRDSQFGPVIMFGLGGVFVELFKDVSLNLTPVSLTAAKEMIERVKLYPLLKGMRGQERYDIDSIADVINKISQMMVDFEEIKEIDINPAMVAHKNRGILAVDCRIII